MLTNSLSLTSTMILQESGVRMHEGCNIIGNIEVNRVPGRLVIGAFSRSVEFDMTDLNTSHVIHNLRFRSTFGNGLQRST